MKDLGFKYSTVAGITVSAADINEVETKPERLAAADKVVSEYDKFNHHGLLTEKEYHRLVVKVWQDAKNQLKEDIKKDVDKNYITNHIYMMSDSGARGNIDNFVQLSGMRGLMAKPNGEEMDIPIRSSFKKGLTMSEFFVSTHGSRKGSTDTALKTAESGYLTRRLVDVSQDVIVSEEDCHTDKGMAVKTLYNNDGTVVVPLFDRIRGRFTNKAVYDPNTGEMLIDKNEFVTDQMAERIVKAGVEEVYIRTLLTCNCHNGVCVKWMVELVNHLIIISLSV